MTAQVNTAINATNAALSKKVKEKKKKKGHPINDSKKINTARRMNDTEVSSDDVENRNCLNSVAG